MLEKNIDFPEESSRGTLIDSWKWAKNFDTAYMHNNTRDSWERSFFNTHTPASAAKRVRLRR